MGSVASKCCSRGKRYQKARKLKAKIRALEEEVKELRRARADEARNHQQSLSVFASAEERWRAERTRQKEAAARLKRQLAEAEGRARRLAEAAAANRGDEKERRRLGADFHVGRTEEERARRDETAAKWKRLYLAIKTELDDLIQRTGQEERIFWGTEEVMIEKLQKELKAKDETMETLRTWISVMEKEGARRDREIGILRQSLKILNKKNRSRIRPRDFRE